MPPALDFFFNIALAFQDLFWFRTNFRIVCPSSVKNAGVILIEINVHIFLKPKSIKIKKTLWLYLEKKVA